MQQCFKWDLRNLLKEKKYDGLENLLLKSREMENNEVVQNCGQNSNFRALLPFCEIQTVATT